MYCRTYREFADHVDNNGDGVCDDCSASMPQPCQHTNMTEWEWISYEQHYRYCSECGFDHDEYADHTGGTADCLTGPRVC